MSLSKWSVSQMKTHYRNPTQTLKQRIREAAFSAFMEKGYAGTNTREIAARAKVSNRELYALYEDKRAMLADCIRFKPEREGLVRPGDAEGIVREAVRANVRASADHLRHGSRILEELLTTGRVAVIGAEYELESGAVHFFRWRATSFRTRTG